MKNTSNINKLKENKGASRVKNEILAGAGIVSLAAGVMGAYFLYGSKDAPKNRKKIRGWTLKAKGEILEKLESVAGVSEEMYHSVVREIADKYKKLKHIDASEIEEFASELLAYWSKIKKDIEKTVTEKKDSKNKTVRTAKKKS